jgi:DNA-directed RNA polymerase specialized sigma24 family protein
MGYSTQEIAELIGIKRGAVLTRLHRARLKLKETIDAAGGRNTVRDNG